VPGHPFDPRAAGPNKLLQEGAVLIQNAEDVLNVHHSFSGGNTALHDRPQGAWTGVELDEKEGEDLRALILQNMSSMPVTVDELVRNCHVTIPAVQMVLLELELAGRIQRLPANRIVLIN
jgi:DNA processing protein